MGGPTCGGLLQTDDGPTLDAIDAILAEAAEPIDRTRKGGCGTFGSAIARSTFRSRPSRSPFLPGAVNPRTTMSSDGWRVPSLRSWAESQQSRKRRGRHNPGNGP